MKRKLYEWRKLSPIYKLQRWRASRRELLLQLEQLRKENDRLQQRLIVLQRAKEQAETLAEDRRREKEAARDKVKAQKQAFETRELEFDQLRAKVTELRDEIERLKARK